MKKTSKWKKESKVLGGPLDIGSERDESKIDLGNRQFWFYWTLL